MPETLHSTAFTETRTHIWGYWARSTPAWSGAGVPCVPLKQKAGISTGDRWNWGNVGRSLKPLHSNHMHTQSLPTPVHKKLLHFAPSTIYTGKLLSDKPFTPPETLTLSLQEDDLDMTMTWPGHDWNTIWDMTKRDQKMQKWPIRDMIPTWLQHDQDLKAKTWPNITETWRKHDRDMTGTWTRTWHTWPGHDYSLTKTWPGTVYNMTKTEVWHDWDRTRTWQDQEITLIWPWDVRNMTLDMTT